MYDKEWFESLAQYRPFNERAILSVFSHLGVPESYLDVGCGDGWMVRTARILGCKPALGTECSPAARSVGTHIANILVRDATRPFVLYDWRGSGGILKCGLVTSIEVGEHLPESAADTYVDNVARHVGKWLVFTAAIPDQGGYGHINCQPPEYWREKLVSRGLSYREDVTEQLRETWKWSTGPMFWLPQNLQVFSAE